MLAHKNHTEDFEGLTYREQAKSLNATMAYVTKAVRAHLRLARGEHRDVEAVRGKCINQVRRLLARLERL